MLVAMELPAPWYPFCIVFCGLMECDIGSHLHSGASEEPAHGCLEANRVCVKKDSYANTSEGLLYSSAKGNEGGSDGGAAV